MFRSVMLRGDEPDRDPSNIMQGCQVYVKSADDSLTLETDESYELSISKAPYIQLKANTVFGALRGLETLSQLIEPGARTIGTYEISDKPRFHYRGSLIDTSRHCYPLNVIFQHIDAMAYAKLNVLHWHIVDDQSFPYQSKTFPEMSRAGAFTPRHVYSIEDVKAVINYAYNRGIRVIPEFDTPGHVTKGWNALNPPVLTDCYDASGKKIGTGPLNPTINRTYEVVAQLYAEIKSVFKDKFVHVGGDEVIQDCWLSNPQIREWMKSHPEVKTGADLQSYYIQRLLEILKQQGSSYIVWQEIFDDGNKLLPDTVVEVWKEENWKDVMAAVTKAGFHSVLSAPFYLNYISYGLDWVKYYKTEPSDFEGGAEAEKSGLLSGLEVCMWSEFVDATNFIPRSWPRTAAVAERAWSDKSVTDVDSAQARIQEFRCKLLERGINAEPIADGWEMGPPLNGYTYCENEWNPRYSPGWFN